jgi:tRNA threonylcarbamoyladenosine biosynthesis protein TsaE
MEIVVELPNVAATEQLGRLLAQHLPPGTVVALSGTLGAGKTRLVQAVAAGCGVDPAEVTSPTFVLCREYHGERMMYHLDAYRLKDEDEFLELGPEEMFASEGLVLIEWAERVESFLPDERVEIVLEVTGETSRRATLLATGESLTTSVEQISRRLSEATKEWPQSAQKKPGGGLNEP